MVVQMENFSSIAKDTHSKTFSQDQELQIA